MNTHAAHAVQVTAADNHQFECWVSPSAVGDTGVVVLQEIFGVTDQLKNLAERYNQQGLHVAIPALFDRVERDFIVPFDNAPRGLKLATSIDREDTLRDISATIEYMRGTCARVVVMGFCWGGGLALRSAQTLAVDGAVVFYGTRMDNCLDLPLSKPVLFHFGSTDDRTPPDLIERVRQKFPDAEYHLYDAGHAFANDARASYVADAADLAHQRSLVFISRI